MSGRRPYDPAEGLGPGRTIVEASAGTGKTFTIAAAVAQLVALEGVPLDRILVVTFTRAATAELKGRVRSRLVLTLRGLGGDRRVKPDDHLERLLALPDAERESAADRLSRALNTFDEAQIFTIHGFAQRLLGQLGFRARLSDALEPGEIDDLVLSQAASDLVVARYVSNPDGNEVVSPKQVAGVARAVLGHPDAAVVPAAADLAGAARARVELGTAVASETRRRMRSAGALTFDDGLLEVRDALADPDLGRMATAMLSARFDIGLIDESQDNDPIQWEIIRAIFDESRLVVIGDPKQSIYSFRGADIEAYLSAAEGADRVRTLTTNWRSDAGLITALDTLFTGTTFGDERIEYLEVEAAPDHQVARIHGIGAPLRLRMVDDGLDVRVRKDGYFSVEPLRDAVASDAASEIVRLLNGHVSITDDDGTRPLSPADIAVLCGKRSQVEGVRHALERRRVPTVTARTGGVLVTPAAEQWRRFLLAVERPDRLDMVRLAATTDLVGMALDEVADLDDVAVLDLQARMREWHDILNDEGVAALLAAVGRHTGLTARILGRADGERLLTDLTHIAEEMHATFRRGRHGSLAAWLETAMTEAEAREQRNAEEPESRQRRLETDADAVTVQTIHGAKGLEYPVVLVPFAWDVSAWPAEYPVFHDESEGSGGTRHRMINVAGRGSPGFDDHQAAALSEDEAEESRLLYVALTRARHHLLVWWVENHAQSHRAKLKTLLGEDGRTPESLATASGGTIEVSPMTELAEVSPFRPLRREPVTLEVAPWERMVDRTWRRVSFTSLSSDQPLASIEERTEHLLVDEGESDHGEEPTAAVLPMAELPGGARFGTLVHELFERVRLDSDDLESEVAALAAGEMRTAKWDFEPAVLARALAAVIATPLGPGSEEATLRDLEGPRLARELAFELPVRVGHHAATLADMGQVMDRHLEADDAYREHVAELLVSPTAPFRGYLAGAIDLVAVMPGERYVVMDYKTNSLPTAGDVATPWDYGPASMAAEMVSHRYVLQATLYQVALHRYLQWRLRGYDPEHHLGGSTYLFVRGMIGPNTPLVDGERCGVARWQPPPAMIVELSRLLEGRSQ